MTDGREMVNTVTFSLLVFALLEHGVHGQCPKPPINQAVYDGSTAIITMSCNSPINESWTVYPTNDELLSKPITNYDDTVVPGYENLYDVTQTNLKIKVSQGNATISPVATSGLYIVQNNTNTPQKDGAKLIVVHEPPTCNCTSINSTSNSISCTIIYADFNLNPIYARVTWKADGVLQPPADVLNKRTKVNGYYTSTSAITTSVNDPRSYQCAVQFTKPMSVSVFYAAMNAPAFFATCNPPSCVTATNTQSLTTTAATTTTMSVRDLCSTPPINQVVYEGSQNTMMTCNSPLPASWTIHPTNDQNSPKQITFYNDTVVPPYDSLYDVAQTNLTIKVAQANALLPDITTAGLYIVGLQYNTSASSKLGAKLVVVREPPTCNCAAISSTSNNLTCNVVYADASFNPIYARVTWKADGVVISTIVLNPRTRVGNYWYSTSAITTSSNDPRSYQCAVQFAKPMDISVTYVAMNPPAFFATCNPSC